MGMNFFRRSAVSLAFVAGLGMQAAAFAEPIRGAGSTFAAPVVAAWAKAYRIARTDGGDFTSPDWTVDYEPVGSLAGVMRLHQPELDFAATDAPLPPEELARLGQKQFPFVLGAVAVVVNLEGVGPGRLRLPGGVLADIYLGRVQSWSDTAIRAANPDLTLPDQKIAVFHRKDGSGSTFALTQFLSAVSPDWKAKYGADQLVAWPLGTGAEGSQGLIRRVTETRGAIAYVEFGQVRRAGLAHARIQNRAGTFVEPDAAGVQAAAAAIDWSQSRDFFVQVTDRPGSDAYPIAAATFAVVPTAGRSKGRVGRVHDLFTLAFDQGGDAATALGYVPLPQSVIDQVKRHWRATPQTGG